MTVCYSCFIVYVLSFWHFGNFLKLFFGAYNFLKSFLVSVSFLKYPSVMSFNG